MKHVLYAGLCQLGTIFLYLTGIYNSTWFGYGFLIAAIIVSLYLWYKSVAILSELGDESGVTNIILLTLIVGTGAGVLGPDKVGPAIFFAVLVAFAYLGVWVANRPPKGQKKEA